MTLEEKYCSVCKEVKPRSAFAINRVKFGGLQSKCKQCRKLRYATDKAERKAKLEELAKLAQPTKREYVRPPKPAPVQKRQWTIDPPRRNSDGTAVRNHGAASARMMSSGSKKN